MKFSVGLFDSLFGEKLDVEVPGPDGTTIRRQVTRRWLEQMERTGQAHKVDGPTVRVHMLHPSHSPRILNWVIGQDVDEEAVSQFRDPESGDLFAMTHYKAGEPVVTVLPKHQWLKARDMLDKM